MIQFTSLSAASDSRIAKQIGYPLVSENIASRILAKDATIWGERAQEEASIRLNWLDAPAEGADTVARATALAKELRTSGITRVVLSGMGGSSLAPEVIARAQGLDLITLDSTDPNQVRSALTDIEHTVLVNSSKSGSTLETDSHRRIFEEAFDRAGIDPRQRIVFVTDPGSPLAQDAASKGFLHVFEADPHIGGRFSALTAFGIVPTILAGGEATQLLEDAKATLAVLGEDSPTNPALLLAAGIAERHPTQNKLIIVEDPMQAVGLGDWIEQLIAESTGKEFTGILPVIVSADAPELRSGADDQIILWLGNQSAAEKLGIKADLSLNASLGEHFLLWEFATSVMGYLLGINPFDQPDVESAKNAARGLLDEGIQTVETTQILPGIGLRGVANLPDNSAGTAEGLQSLFQSFIVQINDKNYGAVQVYLDRPAYPEYEGLRELLAAKTGRPVTFGWGPRFLHSTGQFHKGGQQQGVFLQLVGQSEPDLAIPGRDFSFSELLGAQADGDAQVLAAHGRPVLSLTILDPQQAFEELNSLLKG